MESVELVYAPNEQAFIHLTLAYKTGMSVADVLAESGLMQRYPEIASLTVGIFSRAVSLDTRVQPGDRVEIYRPLVINPKEKRRQRAVKDRAISLPKSKFHLGK